MRLNTRLIMTVGAVFLALIGIILSFLPNEVAAYFQIENTKTIQLILQIAGAQYFAMGMLNWMMRNSVIGGIYNRPVTIANFAHYLIGALALAKGLFSSSGLPFVFYILAGYYLVFVVLYGIIFNRNPSA
jgi:hypothetical protein